MTFPNLVQISMKSTFSFSPVLGGAVPHLQPPVAEPHEALLGHSVLRLQPPVEAVLLRGHCQPPLAPASGYRGQGQSPRPHSLGPGEYESHVQSGPIKGQYLGHVIRIVQSGANIHKVLRSNLAEWVNIISVTRRSLYLGI